MIANGFLILTAPAFGGSIAQLQVDGLEILLDKIESDPKWDSLPQVAYFLATIRHETGAVRNGVLQTYQPIREVRGRPGTRIRRIQDKYWGTGFYGRGYCQITHRANYAKFGIAETPEKALEPDTAYMIAARGMREGLFTGKKLSHYINDQEVDYHDARRIVNGLDKAELIAGYAQKFERILRASLVTDEVTEKPITTEDTEKGVNTGTQEITEGAAGTPPPAPAVEVKASEVPFWTRVTSLSIPAGVVSAVGGIIAFAKDLPPYAWIAFSVIVVAGMVIGYMVWRDGKREAHERTKIVLAAAADRDSNNLRLV